MSGFENVIKELVRVQDEIAVKANLLAQDAKAEWQSLCDKVENLETRLEHDLLTLTQKIGHAEEEFFIGDEQEIESLLTEFKDFHEKVSG